MWKGLCTTPGLGDENHHHGYETLKLSGMILQVHHIAE